MSRTSQSHTVATCYCILLNSIVTCKKYLIIMKREAFKMFLKPGCKEEYKRRHANLFPELKALLSESGVRNYSIYLDEDTNILFAYQELEGEGGSQDLGGTEICQKWWAYMADIMETNPDNSPISIPLPEMFHMD